MAAPFFIESELQALGDVFQDSILTDSCAILRYTRVDDGQGGFTQTWATVETVPCAVTTQPAIKQFLIAEQIIAKGIETILLPRLTDVRHRDRLQVNGDTIYQIVDVADPTTLEVVRRVSVQTIPEDES